MASLALEGVSRTFRHKRQLVHALREVNLAVEDGELLVVVGPSGCGKTTMLRLIAGLEQPGQGVIRIGDRVVNKVPPKDRDVAMVFQNYALYPHMTVRKNLSFPLRMRKEPRGEIQKRVGAAAEMLGIGSLLDRKPAELSGGEQQRVALGRAIVRKPRVFLFDEPLSNLDPWLRMRMRSEIKSLHRELRTTMIYVTHDQEEAMVLADRVAVLRAGRIQQVASPITAYKQPANRFVAEFFGQPQMNFLEGRIVRDGELVVVQLHNGRFAMPNGDGLAAIDDGAVVAVGIRPHRLVLTSNRIVNSAEMFDWGGGNVDWVERLGDCAIVHVIIASGERVQVKTTAADGLAPGSSVGVSFDPRHAHLFGSEGEALLVPAPAGFDRTL